MTSQREEKLFRRRALYMMCVTLTYLFVFLVFALVLNTLLMIMNLPAYAVLAAYIVLLVLSVPVTEYLVEHYLSSVFAQPKDKN
ncbi:MAG: hypothetical protein IKF51_00125 [Solobacterium sp.]|nr:hypothetical protein [Solobacterium sp.]